MDRPDLDQDVELDLQDTSDTPLRCRACGRQITSEGAAVEVSGSADHTFTNPHGFVFEIRCFSAAETRHIGAPTTDHTWFPGYAWQVAVCPACATHLGWAFVAERDLFWGLIKACLVADA